MDCDNGGCHLSPSQFRFAFVFSVKERDGSPTHGFLNFFVLAIDSLLHNFVSLLYFSERIGGQLLCTVIKNMFLLILSLLLNESRATGLRHSHGATGLQRAGALIKEPLNSHKQINDIILTGITDSLEETSC